MFVIFLQIIHTALDNCVYRKAIMFVGEAILRFSLVFIGSIGFRLRDGAGHNKTSLFIHAVG